MGCHAGWCRDGEAGDACEECGYALTENIDAQPFAFLVTSAGHMANAQLVGEVSPVDRKHQAVSSGASDPDRSRR